MNQWSAEQLLHAADMAIDDGRLQDAVTVLGYLMQTHPLTPEAVEARFKYKFLTGDEFSEAGTHGAVADAPTADAATAKLLLVNDAPQGRAIGASAADKRLPADSHRSPMAVAAPAPPAERVSALDAIPRLAEAEDELAVEGNERLGRFLAHLFFGLGFLLLIVGAVLLIYSMAFDFFILWGLISVIVAPFLIGLAYIIRTLLELRRIGERILARVEQNEAS